MYKKLIVAGVLIAFVCVQLAYTLDCYQCDSPSNCRKPSKTSCNEKSANVTRANLNKYFLGVSNTTQGSFECLYMNYTESNKVVMELAGCNFQNIAACSLQINASVGATWAKSNCTGCSGNYCVNPNNPAGTYSSSIYTMLVSLMAVLVTKMLV